jgi:hypothetical protein
MKKSDKINLIKIKLMGGNPKHNSCNECGYYKDNEIPTPNVCLTCIKENRRLRIKK